MKHIGSLRALGLSVALLAAWVSAAAADDVTPNIRKRGTDEKKFVTEMGKAIVKAAHGTAKEPTLVKYEKKTPKEGRTEIHITMEYAGALTGAVSKKKYTSTIDVKVDSANKDAWEVLNIDYKDDNKVPFSAKKVQELVKKLNEK
jgi:hypothetical protein